MRHVFMEFNVDADELSGRSDSEEVRHRHAHYEYLRLAFDGEYDAASGAGETGWLLEGPRVCGAESGDISKSCMIWGKVAQGPGVLNGLTSSIHVELHALRAGLASLLSLIVERGACDSKRVVGPRGKPIVA